MDRKYYESKLREFLTSCKGEIFTLDDVLMFLEMDKENIGTQYAILPITKILDILGCTKEHMTVFTPPPGTSHIKHRFVSREEVYT